MNDPKLHHYVPRFHLARFANVRGHVYTLDKSKGRVFAAGPMALAAETHFYKLPEFIGSEVDPLFLEKQFSEIEGEACSITACWLRQLERLSADNPPTPDGRDGLSRAFKAGENPLPKLEIPAVNRQIMSDFIALQFFRTADARELLKLFTEASGRYQEGVSDDEARSLQARMLCQIGDGEGIVYEFARRIEKGVWMIAENRSEVPFHTSDTPVLLKTPDNRKWLKGPGIFEPGVYVVYAITPNYVLYCKERTWWQMLAPLDNCLSPVLISEEMAQHENSGHAGLSGRFVFSRADDFDEAKAFISDPENFPSLEVLLTPGSSKGDKCEPSAETAG
ncbi:MAG: DUF4238 domain-containing protein [Luteolibacter sp.]